MGAEAICEIPLSHSPKLGSATFLSHGIQWVIKMLWGVWRCVQFAYENERHCAIRYEIFRHFSSPISPWSFPREKARVQLDYKAINFLSERFYDFRFGHSTKRGRAKRFQLFKRTWLGIFCVFIWRDNTNKVNIIPIIFLCTEWFKWKLCLCQLSRKRIVGIM